MNMNLIAEKLIKELTAPIYYANIIAIADALNRVEMDKEKEEKAKKLGIDIETFTVKKVIGSLKGTDRYQKESKDVMEAFTTMSTDFLAEQAGTMEMVTGEGIEDFISLGAERKKHDVRAYQEKIETILDILRQVEEGKNLDQIFIQNQHASKWLHDVLRGKDGAEYQEAIDTIRAKAKGNTYEGSKTSMIKEGIPKEELKNMTCEALAKKYPTLIDYNNGSHRKLISRLKLRLAKETS